MTVMAELDSMKQLLADYEAMKRDMNVKDERIVELKAKVEQEQHANRQLKIFEPLLGKVPAVITVDLDMEVVNKQLCGRLLQLYGRRYKLDAEEEKDKLFSRKLASNAVGAMVQHIVSSNSRWNEVVARYLSE